MSEHDEQAALFQWAALAAGQRPELALMFAIPNGQYRKGQRMEPGLAPGIPDIFLPVARDDRHGLFIELKTAKGRPSVEQLAWIEALQGQGYQAVICYGFDDARAVIEDYLGPPF